MKIKKAYKTISSKIEKFDNYLHKDHSPIFAIYLLIIVLIFISMVLIKDQNLRNNYISANLSTWSNIGKFISGIFTTSSTPAYQVPDPDFVEITEFGTTTEVAVITEDDQASSTDPDYIPSELPAFAPSPESAWASLYLNQMNLKQEDLKLDIRYVRDWQQTGGFTRDLKSGDKGKDVKLMQYLIFIFDPEFKLSNVSGTFGVQTKNALARLQKRLNIQASGIFENETRFFFDSIFYKELCPDANPAQDKSFENVSRRISVPLDYIPSDLIRLPRSIRTVGVMCLSKEPSKRLEAMFESARKEGHELAVFSAYRSSNTQRLLMAYYLKSIGAKATEGLAESGHSEHQLGTTVDISGKSIKYIGPSTTFGNTPEGKWLQDNSYKFGFIMSYPKDKSQDTGYIYEPWHFRYVGVDTAKDIFEEKLTIQEYLDIVQGKYPLDFNLVESEIE